MVDFNLDFDWEGLRPMLSGPDVVGFDPPLDYAGELSELFHLETVSKRKESPKFVESAGKSVVHVRSHKGSGQRTVDLEKLRSVSHLPQAAAAKTLGLGATRFKSLLRELGLTGWPYRMVSSIRNMTAVIAANDVYFDARAVNRLIRKLDALEAMIFYAPTTELSPHFKQFRAAVYKLKGMNAQQSNEGK